MNIPPNDRVIVLTPSVIAEICYNEQFDITLVDTGDQHVNILCMPKDIVKRLIYACDFVYLYTRNISDVTGQALPFKIYGPRPPLHPHPSPTLAA